MEAPALGRRCSVSTLRYESDVCKALSAERDRAVYDLTNCKSELRRVTLQLEEAMEKHKGREESKMEALEAQDALEAEIQRLRADSAVKLLSLESEALEAHQLNDDLQKLNEDLQQKIIALEQQNEERRNLSGDSEGNRQSLYQRLISATDTVAEVRLELQEAAMRHQEDVDTVKSLEIRVQEKSEEILHLTEELKQFRATSEAEAQRLRGSMAEERKAYQALLLQGREAAMDAIRTVKLSLKSYPPLYKSGGTSVSTWLKHYGLEALQTTLAASGFTDLLSIMNLSEQDLIAMKQTPGTRRKFLLAAELLRQQFDAAHDDGSSTTKPLYLLERWMDEFNSTMEQKSIA